MLALVDRPTPFLDEFLERLTLLNNIYCSENNAPRRREADEQDRLKVERAEREMQERLQKELARIQLQLVKSQADCQCRLAWLERFPLVTHRRANQTANAG